MKFKFLHKKVKANALYVVVSLSVVIGIILLGMILITGVFSKAEISLEVQNKLVRNNLSALEYCLASPEIPNEKMIDLFQEETDSVLIIKEPFGVLTKLTIKAFHLNDTVSQQYVLGNKSNSKTRTALIVCNSNKAIGVCGSTLLNGDVVVPERGVERVYIEGQNFVGAKLYNGKKQIAKNELPELHPSIIKNIEAVYLEKEGLPYPSDNDSIIEPKRTIFTSNDAIYLKGVVKGSITIISQKSIIVSKDCELENTVLKAPYIKFESDFSGSVQAFAKDSLVAGSECQFTYPSFLVLKTRESKNFSPRISLGESSRIVGNIVLLQEKFGLKNNGLITIEKNTVVNGTVYSQAYTQLKSCEIQGEVYSKKLYLKTRSSIYENTLLNVKIDPSKKDSNMIDLGINKAERSWLHLR